MICTNGEKVVWDEEHARWIEEYKIPVVREKIVEIAHRDGMLVAVQFADGRRFKVESVFTTRGDIYYSQLARQLGAELDEDGQIITDCGQRTNVPGLYAAGCVTQANCQMIIAAGHGAAAAQAINRSLFEESLSNHRLKARRQEQLQKCPVEPESLPAN
jgi:thioredoxin reductase (NADPH)